MEKQTPTRIAIHWSASNRPESCYHINVLRDGKVIHQAPPTERLPRHTKLRNTGTVAIAAIGMVDAIFEDFGKFALTNNQIEALCAEAANLVVQYNIPIDTDHIFTHCEAALTDGYGPYQGEPDLRWDFMILRPTVGIKTEKQAKLWASTTGRVLRTKIRWYAERIKERKAKDGL